MKEEIVKWGYEYKGYFYGVYDSNEISYVFLKPNGKDEIQLWHQFGTTYWQAAFHDYEQEDFDLLIPE